MANNEAGAFLNITPDVLKKLDSFDDKLEQIQKHAHTAADALKNGFGKVVVDTSKLENAITSLAKKISALNTAGRVFDNIGDSAQQSSVRVESMSSSISSMAQTLNQLKFSNFSIEAFSPENVAKMRETVSQIKSQLKNNTSLSDSDKSALSKEKAMYEEKLKEYQSFINIKNKIAANTNAEELRQQQATYRKMTNVMESYMKKVEEQKRRYENAMKSMADYAAQSPSQRASAINNTLNFSANAKTFQDDVAAIKLLKEARLQLDKTDKNYQATLNQINSAIAKHNQALTEAGVKSQQLATRHSNLMDTAGQLKRQLSLLFSVSQIEGYIGKLANVRGEFELQQRSLQAILQNKSQADQIFNKTVQLAVKSPYKIKELVSFTKQLAAYRIESSKLYDTTKRLADVSAGLGVDMGRLILAYGQVKAAAYLRGSEVRQFTEAGVNMYGELQRYFQEIKGEAYTTAQIVDMISKRKVTFEDVENIFKRLTDSGGLFYNMQEIQAETLQGKISNLQDSIDVMLNSIGKANEDTLKGSIDAVKSLIDNWETVANVGKTLAEVIVSLIISYKILNGSFGTAAKDAMTQAKHFGVLKGMMAGLSGQATKLGASLKTAFLGAIPLLGLTTAIELFSHLISVQREYSKTQKEADNKYYKGQVRVSEIENLSVTLDEKTSKPKIKEALNALVKEMNNEGFNVEIKANLSDEEAKRQYDDLLEQHKNYLDAMLVLDRQYNLDKKNNSWFFWQEDYEDADKNLKESYTRAVSKIPEMQAEIAKLLKAGTGIDDTMREELKSLEQGVKESGSLKALQEYYTKLGNILNKIKQTIGGDVVFAGDVYVPTISKTTFAGVESNVLEGVRGITDTLDKSGEKIKEKVRDVFTKAFSNKLLNEDTKVALARSFINENSEIANLIEQILTDEFNLDFTKKGKTGNNTGSDGDPKLQRDIWSERISVLKEMQSRYEKLNQLMGENAAIEQTLSAFKPALEFTGMDKMNIIPTKEGMIKAYEELLKDVTDSKKITELKKIIAELKIEIQQDDLKEQLETTKKNIEDLFNGLDLHQKLKDAGLSESDVQQLFPGLAKTLDDVEKGIRNEYEAKRDKNGELSKTDQKDYDEALKKLNQQRIKESQDLVVELTKNYKTQLSDQMQLDTWYIKERSKIYSKAYDEQTKTFKDILTPEMQKQYEANLNKEYQKRSSENTWKNFQATDYYIDMFENLDRASTASIKGMLERLQDLRSSLKDLPADQVRAIINQMEKLQETVVSRNPFKTFGESLKAYHKALLELKKVDESGNLTDESTTYEELEESQGKNARKLADIEAERNAENRKLEVLKQQKEEGEKYKTLSEKELEDLEENIAKQQDLTDKKILQAEIQGKITKAESDQLRNVRNLKKLSEMSAEEIVNGIGQTLSQIGSELPNIASNLENVFGTMSDGMRDTIDTLSEVMGGLGSAVNGIGQIMTSGGNPFQIISGGLQAIGGVTKAIGALFAIGDKKKEREIQRQIANVEKLQKAYEVLKEKMDEAWNSVTLHDTTKQTVANIDQQISSYQQMIKAEQDKKDTDQARIDEWNEAIKELEKTKQEILKQEQMDLGGIGGNSEYKSAAENFVQSWMDAFNETGKGIEGLEDSFDNMIENLIVKQATMRLAQGRLKKLFEEIDKSVTDDSAGGINLTKEELANINAIADTALAGLNEDLLNLMDTLGYKGKGKTAELSSLTQSIQGVTEQTAEELSALLGSVRFFVSQQTTDISAIRALLDARYSLETEYSDSNPMLIELRAQTGYLEILSDRIDRVFAPSANSKGAGLRVFMQ